MPFPKKKNPPESVTVGVNGAATIVGINDGAADGAVELGERVGTAVGSSVGRGAQAVERMMSLTRTNPRSESDRAVCESSSDVAIAAISDSRVASGACASATVAMNMLVAPVSITRASRLSITAAVSELLMPSLNNTTTVLPPRYPSAPTTRIRLCRCLSALLIELAEFPPVCCIASYEKFRSVK